MTVSPFTDAAQGWSRMTPPCDDAAGGMRNAAAQVTETQQGGMATALARHLTHYSERFERMVEHTTTNVTTCQLQADNDSILINAPSPHEVDAAKDKMQRWRHRGQAAPYHAAKAEFEALAQERDAAYVQHMEQTEPTPPKFQPLEDTLPADTPLPNNRPKTPMQDGGDGEGGAGTHADTGEEGVPMLPKDTPLPLVRSADPSATDNTLTPVRPADPTTFGGHDFTPTHLSSDMAASSTPQPPMMPPMQMTPQAGGGAPGGMPGMPGAFPGIPGGASGGWGRARPAAEEKKRTDDIDNAAVGVGAAGIGTLAAAGVAGAADAPPRTITDAHTRANVSGYNPPSVAATGAAPAGGAAPPAGGGMVGGGGGALGGGGGVHGANSTVKKVDITAHNPVMSGDTAVDASVEGGLIGRSTSEAPTHDGDHGRKAS